MDTPPDTEPAETVLAARGRRRWRWLAGATGVAVLAAGVVWVERLPLATEAIDHTLATLDLVATYHVAEVGPTHVVLTDVVVGDPAHPDLSVARVEVGAGFTGEGIGLSHVRASGVHLRGAWRDNALHFGALDPLINAPSGRPARLPALDLSLTDAVAELTSPWGAAVVRAAGSGALRDGFAGRIHVAAVPLAPGCHGGAARAALSLAIRDEVPRLTGPIDIAAMTCGAATVGAAHAALDVRVDRALTGGDGNLALRVPGGLRLAQARIGAARAGARMTWRGGRLVGVWQVQGSDLAAPALTARQIEAEGGLRAGGDSGALRIEGNSTAGGLALTRMATQRLAQAGTAAAGTPLAPLGAVLAQSVALEMQGAHASAAFTLRHGGGHLVLVVPEAAIAGRSGAMLARGDRLMLADGAVSGHLATGGPGLPQIDATVDRPADAPARLTLAMADYAAGGARLALPGLSARQDAGGTWHLAGQALVSGPLGAGSIAGLALPLDGTWHDRSFALWPHCAAVAIEGATQGALRLGHAHAQVCPDGKGPVLALADGALRIGARIPALALSGTQDGAPVHATAADLVFGDVGGVADLATGALVLDRGADHLAAARITAHLADGAATGTIAGGVANAAVLPLDLGAITGDWRYAGGALDLTGALTVADRAPAPAVARFAPLAAHDAHVHLVDNVATATATLTEPTTGRTVATLSLRHDLAITRGHADFVVPDLTFDKALQPTQLSPLALGVVADVKGTVTGRGRLDWIGDNITSSGTVSTTGLDLAAAFGPVTGVQGTIDFTDLLGLVTPPHQFVRIATINPGIEVDNGRFAFQLQPGHVLAIEGATWPFLDGQLTLLPTRMTLGAAEERRYELVVKGLDAAKFLVHMGVSNLSATGRFDGDLPLVFDRDGNGSIVGGMLAARAPGGTVSYIGDLTYHDLSPMGNYAFQMLRSLRYTDMEIAMDGPISGEIVTRVGMDGIRQGPGAKRNFITRQIARLPIRFNVNIRAPFYQLMGSYKSFFDSSLVADPRSIGLIDAQGHVIAHPVMIAVPGSPPSTAVQPPLIAPVPQGAPQ